MINAREVLNAATRYRGIGLKYNIIRWVDGLLHTPRDTEELLITLSAHFFAQHDLDYQIFRDFVAASGEDVVSNWLAETLGECTHFMHLPGTREVTRVD